MPSKNPDLAVANASPDGRRARKLQITVDHICAVAWDLFETQGFDAVTMETIAESADVAKGTLYKHFPAKETLVGYRFAKDRQAQAKRVEAAVMAHATCAERLAARLQEEVVYIEKMRRYAEPFIRYQLHSEQFLQRAATPNAMDVFTAGLIAQGQATGEITSDIPVDRLVGYLNSLRLALFIRWLRTPEMSLTVMNQEMLSVFLSGVRRTAVSSGATGQ
jgi:AcrR family transcriptional regulator